MCRMLALLPAERSRKCQVTDYCATNRAVVPNQPGSRKGRIGDYRQVSFEKDSQVIFKNILFLERGEGKEKERERNISVRLLLVCPLLGTSPATQACALAGNRTDDPLVLRPTLSPLSYTSQGPSDF